MSLKLKLPWLGRWVPYAFLGLIAVLVFTGGASAPEELHQIPARLAAIAVLAMGVIALRKAELAKMRDILVFLSLLFAAIAIQLVPLPPGVWASLPGRGPFVEGFELIGLEPVWRPISLTPDRTLNSLLALLPAFAAAVGMAFMDRDWQRPVLLALLAVVAAAIIIGIIQVSTDNFYIYRTTNRGFAVGLFANRNHQAALLAAAYPLLAAWAGPPAADRQFDQARAIVALVMAALIAALLLATGSRAGLALGAAGLLGAFVIVYRARASKGMTWRRRAAYLAPLLVIFLAVGATLYFARDVALQRLLTEESANIRTGLAPIYQQIVWDFFPFGSGFGSFDPVFRMYEPAETIGPSYLNHAHNDLFQIVIEAGLIGAALVLLFAAWFARRAWQLWSVRGRTEREERVLLGRAGSLVILLLAASSAVDYPLRTPLLSFIFVIAATWMLPAAAAAAAGKRQLASERR
jgi:O-antigen ligase